MTTFSSQTETPGHWNSPLFWRAPTIAVEPGSTPPAPRRRSVIKALLQAIVESDRRFREREAMRQLPNHLRRDVGLPLLQVDPADRRR